MYLLKKLTRLYWVLRMIKEYNQSIQQKRITPIAKPNLKLQCESPVYVLQWYIYTCEVDNNNYWRTIRWYWCK